MAASKRNTNGIKPKSVQLDKLDEKFCTEKLAELMAETEGLVPSGFAQQIEEDFTKGDMGIARRLAMVFLERRFAETVATIGRDRDFALATASMQRSIQDYLDNYNLLVQWLGAAHVRMMFAVCTREDSDEIFAEVDRERGGQLQ